MEEVERLRGFFDQRGYRGIVRLINHLAEGIRRGRPCCEIGSSSWIDNERVLDEITLAMSKYGFPHLPAYQAFCECSEHAEWHKHLYIGGSVSPLDWLTLFSMNLESVLPKALALFDSGCNWLVEMEENSGEEVVDLDKWLEKGERLGKLPGSSTMS
jgi:hypothetical protein